MTTISRRGWFCLVVAAVLGTVAGKLEAWLQSARRQTESDRLMKVQAGERIDIRKVFLHPKLERLSQWVDYSRMDAEDGWRTSKLIGPIHLDCQIAGRRIVAMCRDRKGLIYTVTEVGA